MGNCWSFQANPKNYADAVVDAHNYFRAHHGSPALTLDNKMCQEASMLANLCAFYDEEIPTYGERGYSENIFSDFTVITNHSPFKTVNEWYSTLGYHDFSKGWNEKSAKFSKLIWKSSVKIGIGFARTTDKYSQNRKSYVVCYYHPAAIPLEASPNVRPPISTLSIPAARIYDKWPVASYNSKKPLTLFHVEPKVGWGLSKDVEKMPSQWKVYFSQTWAADAWKIYQQKHQRQEQEKKHDLQVEKNMGISEANAEGHVRRRRSVEPSTLKLQLHGGGLPTANINRNAGVGDEIFVPVTQMHDVKYRFVSPEIRKSLKRKADPHFAFQRFYHNV